MPITSSVIAQDTTTGSGNARVVVEQHTWHDGIITPIRYIAEGGADVNAAMLARVSILESSAKSAELENLFDLLHDENAITATVMTNLRHNTEREALASFLHVLNDSDSPRRLFDMARYLKDNVNAADVVTEVGQTAADALQARAQIMIDSEATYNAAYQSSIEF